MTLSIRNAPETDVIGQNFRTCDCPIPKPLMNWHPALGVLQVIRLCCLAKSLGALEVYDFEPSWDWDCDAVHQDGEGELRRRGCPPSWLLHRLQQALRPVHHKGVQH